MPSNRNEKIVDRDESPLRNQTLRSSPVEDRAMSVDQNGIVLSAEKLDEAHFPPTAESSNLKNILSQIRIDSNVRPEAVKVIQDIIEQLDPIVIQAFIESNLRIDVTAYIELIKPNQIDKFPAYYQSDQHLVVLSDNLGWRNFLTEPFVYEPMSIEDIKHYSRHELGHAFHAACMGTKMFVPTEVEEAHKLDVAELSDRKRSDYFYYIQGTQEGSGYLTGLTTQEGQYEAIAQGFSALWGDRKIPNFTEDFPRTCYSILKHIGGFSREQIESEYPLIFRS